MSKILSRLSRNVELQWKYLRTVRSVKRDRVGAWYWYSERSSDVDSYTLNLKRFRSVLDDTALSIAWISLARSKDTPFLWWIRDVRSHDQQRGLGTILVRAAITFVQKRGALQLKGSVIETDAEERPFLLSWYNKLGFTVEGESEHKVGQFSMYFA